MSFPDPRKESVYVDHSSVYFENERLAGKMRQRVDSLTKDKHRVFLSRQAEIAGVRRNLDKLHAFRKAVSNIDVIQLTSRKYTNYRMPNIDHTNENVNNQETNKTPPRTEGSALHTNRDQISGDVKKMSIKSSSPSLKSEKILTVLPNGLSNRISINQNRHLHVRTPAAKYITRDLIYRLTPLSKLRPTTLTVCPHKALILGTSGLERKKSAPLRKASAHTQGGTRSLNKRPSSGKEQWAGVSEGLAPKITSPVAMDWPRFRSSQTRRVCTAVSSPSFSEALTLRRLRELYILDESKCVMSGQRQANLMRYLLVLNQKHNQYLQEKVRNFLEELGGKRPIISVCSDVSTRISYG